MLLHMFKKILSLDSEESGTSSNPTLEPLSLNSNPQSEVIQTSSGDDYNRYVIEHIMHTNKSSEW